MKLSSLLIAAVAACVNFAFAQDATVADQLLQTLDQFNSTDPLISELEAAIEDARAVLDSTITRRSILSPTARSRLACRMLKCVLEDYYTDSTNQTAYNTLKSKNWFVHLFRSPARQLIVAQGRATVICQQHASSPPSTQPR